MRAGVAGEAAVSFFVGAHAALRARPRRQPSAYHSGEPFARELFERSPFAGKG